MKILIIGEQQNFVEFKQKFGEDHNYSLSEDLDSIIDQIDDQDLIFDYLIDENPEVVEAYSSLEIPVFINTVKITLAELNYVYGLTSNVFGFNGIQTFVNRPQLEITALTDNSPLLKKAFKDLNKEFLVVDDRVGMVTPRIIFMIINEAFYTIQEGTASKKDIDLGMKLGTNYPFGPFEWAERIGIKDIYETLEALFEDTKEDRYKICPLLKREYLNS